MINWSSMFKTPPTKSPSFSETIKNVTQEHEAKQVDIIKLFNLLENPYLDTAVRTHTFSSNLSIDRAKYFDWPTAIHTAPTSQSDVTMWYWNFLRLKANFTYWKYFESKPRMNTWTLMQREAKLCSSVRQQYFDACVPLIENHCIVKVPTYLRFIWIHPNDFFYTHINFLYTWGWSAMIGSIMFVKLLDCVDHIMTDTFLMLHCSFKPVVVGITAYDVPAGMDPIYLRDILCWPLENYMAEQFDKCWRGIDYYHPSRTGQPRYFPPTDYMDTWVEPIRIERLYGKPLEYEPVIVYTSDSIKLPPHTIILPDKNILR